MHKATCPPTAEACLLLQKGRLPRLKELARHDMRLLAVGKELKQRSHERV